MQHVFRVATALVIVALVVPLAAPAATFTFGGRMTATAVLSNNISATFTAGGITVQCTTHTVLLSLSDISGGGTSLTVRAANQRFSVSASRGISVDCPYTAGIFGSGVASMTVPSDWSLTATNTTSVGVTLPNNGMALTLTTGMLRGCSITVASTTQPAVWDRNRHILTSTLTLPVSSSGCPIRATSAQLSETLFIPALTLS
jgi:hypothetical protein